MKQTLTTYQIAGLLMADENARWTRSAAYALAEYYQELEESTGQEIEFDQVAIRCEWTLFSSLADIGAAYSVNVDGLSEQRAQRLIRRYVEDRGQLIELKDGSGFLITNF
jgi:flavin-dependent dehydrogenase